MKSLVEHLSRYATYHRDPRNIATHFIGVPMIVVAVTVLLSRPGLSVLGGAWVSPAAFAAMAAAWFYLRLDERYGVLMSIFLGLCLWVGQVLAEQDTLIWLSAGLGLFVIGWAIQFVGHYYEGRRPAFVDDLTGLIVGPLFVVAELGFLMGMRLELKREIERIAGPVGLR